MKAKTVIYIILIFSTLCCKNKYSYCKEINAPTNQEELRQFILKSYSSAKSIVEDARIEYETTQIRINSIPLSTNLPNNFHLQEPSNLSSDSFIKVQEYIKKNSKERWVNLYTGKSAPMEDVSYRAELVRTKESPHFKVFDGQQVLDYYPVTDGFTKVGRASLDIRKESLFELPGPMTDYAPVKFFGYWPGLMPDDVLSNPQVNIETKPEIINGLLTYKVSTPVVKDEIKYNIVYWLVPERSCLPVKIDVEVNGELSRHLEVKEFMQIENGQWAIKSILQRNYVSGEEEKKRIENINLLYTIRKIELNPKIDEETIFSTLPDNLPEGTEVIDNISGLRYFAEQGPISDKIIHENLTKSLELINEIPDETIEKSETVKNALTNDPNKPLFSNKGILASQTNQKDKQETQNKLSILSIALGGTGIIAAALLAIVVFHRLVKKGRLKK